MRMSLIQLQVTDDEAVGARVERAAGLVREQAGADLVVLPELWHVGAFSSRRWADAAQTVEGPVVAAVRAAAADAGVMLHAGSFVERSDDGERGLFNTSAVVDGRLPGAPVVATYRKIHRFGHGEGESALVDAGSELVTVDVPTGSGAGADGAASLTLGLSTCYDLRFPELYRGLVDRGAELLVIPAGWPAARVEHWRVLARARAIESQAFVLACNTAGTHAGLEMGGRSAVIGPDGTVLAEAGTGEEVLTVDLDPGAVAEARESFPVLLDRVL